MNFVNSSILTGVSTVVKLASNLIITKLVAYFYGANGMFLLGNLANFLTFLKAIATGGIEQGTVKYVSQYEDHSKEQKKTIVHSLQIAFVFSSICGVVLLLFRNQISTYVLLESNYAYLFAVTGISTVFFSLNLIFLNILNGLREIKRFVLISLVGNIFSLLVTLLLLYFYELDGVLLGFCINQAVVIIPTLLFVYKDWWLQISLVQRIQWAFSQKLFRFSLMAFASALTVPMTYFLLRKLIGDRLGIDQAGMWEALVRLSSVFLMVLAASYSTYLLPTFSSLPKNELRKELFKVYKIVIPISFIGVLTLYFLRVFIIKILYSDEFLPIQDLFLYQILGDGIKAITLVTGYLIIAKGMTKAYVFNEVLQMVVYMSVSYLLLDQFKLLGVTIAHLTTALSCLVFQLILFRKVLWPKN
ncbi:MAG: O-antigen/teichoic acid export membrane protein [Psychroserpens sp.]|jgi:O-antigen/teichoic acid export membrane protein